MKDLSQFEDSVKTSTYTYLANTEHGFSFFIVICLSESTCGMKEH